MKSINICLLLDLCRDGGFDDNNSSPLFYSFVAEERASETVIGYALCFFSYSTWQGRSLFVEDLYVKPDYRKQGIGKMLFVELAKFAEESNCMRFDLHVLDWNPARSFYEKLGGKDLTNAEGWHFCRFDRKAISALANKPN